MAVSPKPTAAAFAEASNTPAASAASIPAEVIKNIASASSCGARAVEPESFITLVVRLFTSASDLPTKLWIFVIDASKSDAILNEATPRPTIGAVSPIVIFLPAAVAFAPNLPILSELPLSRLLKLPRLPCIFLSCGVRLSFAPNVANTEPILGISEASICYGLELALFHCSPTDKGQPTL